MSALLSCISALQDQIISLSNQLQPQQPGGAPNNLPPKAPATKKARAQDVTIAHMDSAPLLPPRHSNLSYQIKTSQYAKAKAQRRLQQRSQHQLALDNAI